MTLFFAVFCWPQRAYLGQSIESSGPGTALMSGKTFVLALCGRTRAHRHAQMLGRVDLVFAPVGCPQPVSDRLVTHQFFGGCTVI
jgi:hypothetical protein